MSYRVFFNFDNGIIEDFLNETFPTRKDAYLAAIEASSDYAAGQEVLELGGEDPGENIIGWKIVEVKKK